MKRNILILAGLMTACNIGYKEYEYSDASSKYAQPIYEMDSDEYIAENQDDGIYTNPWIETSQETTSTFAADVDSGSYSLMRRHIMEGSLPESSTVRIEEFINYFSYDDVGDYNGLPFAVQLESAPSAFGDAEDIHLLRIGIQAEEIPEAQRDPVNLVFLLDVSGSMSTSDKLGLVKYAMKHLVNKLSPQDTLGIVVYAGAEGVVLEPTAVENKSEILDALEALQAGGSTNGEAGIRSAYAMAESAFRQDGVNRVILCSDGDMNVGLTGDALIELIEEYRDKDIFLTTLGVGMGNYQDDLMEQLADHGNGNYAYIDSQNEALSVLGEKLVSTLQVVAKDLKVQVEFDSKVVERWRLIGYENRVLDNEDFVNDAVDAGDIGAGHSVTALYEIDLADAIDEIPAENEGSIATVRMRYKEPTGDESTEHEWKLLPEEREDSFEMATPSLKFAAAVAEFGEILRGSPHSEGDRFDDIHSIAQQAISESSSTPSKEEFLSIIDQAKDLFGE